ncbi:MAG: helix-turn-helix transcriptional regulator [Promethearchaeota archaeon]|nr:MAG: helix-turn-helix transcriptional regulator [Candidatus Lokiarchaeota archaeon]
MSKNENIEKSVIDVLKSSIRFRIYSLLHLYPELSLSEISKKMGKSKSTIHHHLKELIDYELIELSREEKVRGNILAKFYSLKPGHIEKLSDTDSETHKATQATIDFLKTYLNFALRTIELYKNFFESFELQENGIDKLKELLKDEQGFSSMVFLSEEKFKKVHRLYQEFVKEVNKIEIENGKIKDEKPFFIFTLALPLKKVIEEMTQNSQIKKK